MGGGRLNCSDRAPLATGPVSAWHWHAPANSTPLAATALATCSCTRAHSARTQSAVCALPPMPLAAAATFRRSSSAALTRVATCAKVCPLSACGRKAKEERQAL